MGLEDAGQWTFVKAHLCIVSILDYLRIILIKIISLKIYAKIIDFFLISRNHWYDPLHD